MRVFDYLKLIERVLDSCRRLEDPPHVPRIELHQQDTAMQWKDTVRFTDGHVLSVTEYAIFGSDGEWTRRNFKYDFRRSDKSLVFRIDTHGVMQSASEPCHVDTRDEEKDRIPLPPSPPIDFSYAMRCIERYFSSQAQDWERNND